MREGDVRERAFAVPLTNPAYPPRRYRFVNREFLIINYRTDPEKLALVPEPLGPQGGIVKYEFLRMPDSTGVSANASKTKPARPRDVSDEKTNAHSPLAKTGLQSIRPRRPEMSVGDQRGPIALGDNRWERLSDAYRDDRA